MKTIIVASLIALAFTTGFTCSKNQPAADQPAATQEQMAAPTEAPAEAPTEAPTEAPMEGAPSEETK